VTDEELRQRHLDAVGMAARLTDSGRVALASQFGQDAVPIIAMGICLGVFMAADVSALPESARKRFKKMKDTFDELTYEAAIDYHDKLNAEPEPEKLIVLAPTGMSVERNDFPHEEGKKEN